MMTNNEPATETKGKFARIIALVSLVAIALGGFNDTTDALKKIYDFSLSKFTDIPSQEKLDNIYIRASSDILEQNFGAPVYIKQTYNGELIKYYKDDRFILSVISKGGAISAYLVFPESGFYPDTSASSSGQELLTNSFDQQESVNDIRATISKTITYYIEENTTGEFSNLYSSVSGYSEFNTSLTPEKRATLTVLVDDMLLGEDISEPAIAVRKTLLPNFYGYSTLGLAALEEAILTNSEFRLINP
ncbi:ETEC_3214 domain-containing protein [Shewanella sp. 10N.261.52.F9]|uniref:ETEC_3214 domain-containing protein n=1 Tax=Shewanella sp. 10N.261.52.F9 TaxID=3229684 RepID=UPI00354FD012